MNKNRKKVYNNMQIKIQIQIFKIIIKKNNNHNKK